jgi:hypothetical protein
MGMAKAFIMVVRVLGLTAIVVGSLLWMGGHQVLLGPHIGLGFCVVVAVFVMSVLAMVRGAIGTGIAGILLALVLPMVGFMQLPVIAHSMGAIQVAHIAIALSIIGLAERLYSAIQRAG